MRAILKILLLLLCAACSNATTINVGTMGELTNALLTTGQKGDPVVITNNITLAADIIVNRGFSIDLGGQGTNSTTLTLDGGRIWFVSNDTNVLSIHDFKVVFTPNNSGFFGLMCGSTAYEFPGPYHIYNLLLTNVCGRGISVGYGKSHNSYGLIDHCAFYPNTNGYWQQHLDFEGAGISAWTNSNPIGTTNVSCNEDCYFYTLTNGLGGNGFFDAYVGAQVAVRHCIFDGWAPIGGHGYDSQPQSIRTWEIYNNLFTNNINPNPLMIWRGGSGVVFSNQCWGTFNTIAGLLSYRATPELFGGQSTRSGYLTYGAPGQGYIINFANTPAHGGVDMVFNGQPMNGELMVLGHTFYYFLTNLSEVTFGQSDSQGFGGGAVKIGANVAETVSNFFNAVNVVPGYSNISYAVWPNTQMRIGYEFIAVGYDPLNLYLTNALDCNTNQFGYPSFDQCGVIGDLPLTGTNFVQQAVKWPAYCWGNAINGASNNNMVIGTPGSYMTNIVKEGRDFFNDAPAPNYTPLVYPHPLNTISGGGSTFQGTRASARF